MDFLKSERKKVFRTTLYDDQEFTRFEVELLHTPLVQRLYHLRQLGFADRVFPDAVHTRLNHVLGVAETADRMATRLQKWLQAHPADQFRYATDVAKDGAPAKTQQITGEDLSQHVAGRKPALRLMGLLHDITHAAFGHTLEDEVHVFTEKHDAPVRQRRFFDALTAQLLAAWCSDTRLEDADPDGLEALSRLEIDEARALARAEVLSARLTEQERSKLDEHLRDLETAYRLLILIEFLHQHEQRILPAAERLLISDVRKRVLAAGPEVEVVLHRDAFLVDLIGNTICADLLDYARRDAHNAGLRVQFDARLLRYVCVVSVAGRLSPTGEPCIRSAMQFFTDKMRHDVLSEMSGILKARYLINERVLFHPTKCAAGAMLGTAAQLLGLNNLPPWAQVAGDQEFLRLLRDLAERTNALHSEAAGRAGKADPGEVTRRLWPSEPRMNEMVLGCYQRILDEAGGAQNAGVELGRRINGARMLLWRLSARRYPKLVYRLRVGVHQAGGAGDETIADTYRHPEKRFALERRIENLCGLPPGAVVVHCPRRKMSMKVAEALVVGSDLTKVAHLRDVTSVIDEGLGPYQSEIRAIEEMYRSIWQLHVYLDSAHEDKRAIVAKAVEEELHFSNDKLLADEAAADEPNAYDLIAGEFKNQYAWDQLPEVIRRIDADAAVRMRLAPDLRQRVKNIMRDVALKAAEDEGQLQIPGLGRAAPPKL